MPKLKRLRRSMNDHVAFLQGFLKSPKQVGSIIPSSRFLERRLVEIAGIQSALTIVELGSGTGGTTRAILQAMPREANLLSIEINPRFFSLLTRIHDSRLISHLGSAQDLHCALSQYGLPSPEVVISGIPFSTLDRPVAAAILEAIASALAPRGRFVAYQVLNRIESLSFPYLGPAQVEMEFLNIPPIRVYRWEK